MRGFLAPQLLDGACWGSRGRNRALAAETAAYFCFALSLRTCVEHLKGCYTSLTKQMQESDYLPPTLFSCFVVFDAILVC